jgi:NTE family protein
VDRIVGVDAFLGMTFQRPKGLLDLIKNSVDIVLVQAARPQISKADLLITPDLKDFSSTEFKDVPGLVEAGYRAAQEALAENPWMLG